MKKHNLDIAEKFIGTWRMVRYQIRAKNGEITYPYGQDGVGYITYNREGFVSVAIMRANRPKFTSHTPWGGVSPEEHAAAARDYSSYVGRYEIQEGKVLHHVEVSLYPNWINDIQVRMYRFEGDRLYLSTESVLLNGVESYGIIEWIKV